MKKLKLFCMAALLTAALSLPALAEICYGNYSTVMGTNSFSGKVFISDDGKIKTESGEYVMISRVDKKVSWTLMPSMNTYSERPLGAQSSSIVATKLTGEIGRTKVGDEIINELNCEKFKVKCKEGKKTLEFYQWISADHAFPIKAAKIDGTWSMELSQLQPTTQPDTIFDLPAGFSKI